MSRWWRAYDEAVDDPKLQRLPPALFKSWFNLCCIASKNGGTLPPIGDVAFRLHVTEHKAAEIITALVAAGLIDRREDQTFEPHNWEGRQYKSDVTDPTAAERMKRYRKNRNAVTEKTVTATPPRVQNAEAETEQIKDSSLRSLDRKRDPFDEFWEIYPKRDGTNPRHPARKRFIAALKSGIEPDTIISGARTFAAECKERGHVGTPYVAQATTWLNQRRWGDVPTEGAPTTGPPSDLTPEQQADWAKGWRPGMPTSAELKARSTTNGHAHHDSGANHPKELFPKGAGVRGDASEGHPQKPPNHH